eukprot:Seg847.5 transcript_id=Seg847.5/GoldUCD/mRNA.D3Y31 product="putative protein F13E9.13 mitochondrial" protein_id=Seg847.5/GoldUCD/D3Y31
MAAGSHAIQRFLRVFKGKLPAVIGMIHVSPLPGTPTNKGKGMKDIIHLACTEADVYQKSGIDAILIENMHDIPYLNRDVGPEIVAGMTAVGCAVKSTVGKVPCGIQILAGCNTEAMAVAKACNFDFIRAEGFVFSHVADEGIMNSDAGHVLRYRKVIDADEVLVFTDVKKKHSSHAITQDLDLTEIAKAAEFFLSDGVIITGSHTGDPAKPEHISTLNDNKVKLPLLIGSGVDDKNLPDFMNAHALIVGSYFKEKGDWRNTVDPKRVSVFMDSIAELRPS